MSRFVAAFATNTIGEVLLVQHRERDWELPGGTVWEGEPTRVAAAREAWEEAGLVVQLSQRTTVVGETTVHHGVAEGVPRPQQDPQITEARWCSREQVRMMPLSEVPSAAVLRRWASDSEIERIKADAEHEIERLTGILSAAEDHRVCMVASESELRAVAQDIDARLTDTRASLHVAEGKLGLLSAAVCEVTGLPEDADVGRMIEALTKVLAPSSTSRTGWSDALRGGPRGAFRNCHSGDAMSVVCVVALVTDRIHHLPSARVALIESNKPGRRVELPGGKALEGEPPYLATRREMREELGIEVTNLEPLQSIHGEPRPGAEFTSAIWVFRGRTAAAMLVAGDDAKRAFWASRQDVLELERHGCLSDLASKAVLLDWARQAPEVAPEAPVSAADVAVPMLRMASEHLDEIGRLRAEIASLRAAKAAPLTEEEARRWLDRIFGGSGAGEAPEGSFRDALLSASRGEIPPEVRASATVSRDPGHPLPTPPAGEMAVTDGAEGETP